jgi:uncharacterized protein YjbJ (UPF0337 family)
VLGQATPAILRGVKHELGSHRRQLEAIQGRAKEQWGKLTDDDIDVIAGKRDQLVGKIQESYGIGKDEAEQQVDTWGSGFRDEDLRKYQ